MELGQADIAAIQQLYGPKTSKTLTTRFSPNLINQFKILTHGKYFGSAPSPSSSPAVGLHQPWNPQVLCTLRFFLTENQFMRNSIGLLWSEVNLAVSCWQQHASRTFGHIIKLSAAKNIFAHIHFYANFSRVRCNINSTKQKCQLCGNFCKKVLLLFAVVTLGNLSKTT